MSSKNYLLACFGVTLVSVLMSYLGFHLFWYWPAAVGVVMLNVSILSVFLKQKLDQDGVVLVSFFSVLVFRFIFVGSLALIFQKLRNTTELYFLIGVFGVYFCYLVFELKYILSKLRAN